MRIKHLLSTCLLLGSLASCTSDQVLPHEGGEINGNVPAQGAVVFSLEGLGSGSVVNPSTRATTVLATEEENRIDSLDIYVFAFDDDGTFDEDLTSKESAVIDKLTPTSDADVANHAQWYLQEKWTWKNPESGHSSGKVDTSLPQLHEIAQLGGSGVARTATIYPQKGRYLKFFIVANGGELTQTDADAPWTPAFTTTDAGTTTTGTKAEDFLKLRIRLGARPLAADQVLPIGCPLPMTAGMANTLAGCVNLTATATPVQATRSAVLTRAVTRFDIVNYAALPSQGDYTLTDVIINGHYAFTDMKNEVPAASAPKPAVKVNLEGRTWSNYSAGPGQPTGKLLKSAFYTSPTLAGTDPMMLGLRGVLGQSSAQPGELLTRLNKDVKVVNGQGAAIQLKANYRYLINIKKLGSDVNVAFSILDWDSRVLDADFSNAPMPILICENAQGISWNVSDTDMNQHFVSMANTAVGGRLAFELGTYNADEMADLILTPDDPTKIPFDAAVLSLNTDPSMPLDNTWLGKPVITFDPLKRDRFTVTLDVRPEAQVPLYVRPDLLVKVWNKEHREKEIFFRVTSTWTTPERPEDTTPVIDDTTPKPALDGGYAIAGTKDPNFVTTWDMAVTNVPAGWRLLTWENANQMAGMDLTKTGVNVNNAEFLAAFPDLGGTYGTSYWLANENTTLDQGYCLTVQGSMVTINSQPKSARLSVCYFKFENPEYGGLASSLIDLGGGKTPVYVAPKNVYDKVQFKNANFAPGGMCPAGWKVPTKDEVMDIFGLQYDDGMPEDVSTDILKGWPAGAYWTQTAGTTGTGWMFTIAEDGRVGIDKRSDSTDASARCVKIKQ